jgi:type VI secretion system secreted protein VgrG
MRTIEVIPPGGDEWGFAFERLTGWEGLGRPFWFDVDLLTKRGDVDKTKMLGEPMTVVMMTGPTEVRYFSGVVARFAQVAWTGELFRYRAQLRPWLWLLSRTSNSRVFQPLSVKANPMTIPKIVEKVFKDHGFSDFDLGPLGKGNNRFSEHDYIVQYQETDFNFVSRLMEAEGIYYYFTHALGKHQMLVADSVAAHEAKAGYEAIPYFPPDAYSADRRERDHIQGWSVEMQIEPGAYVAKDYDFENPTAPRLSTTKNPGAHAQYSTFEMFEYPGRLLKDPQRDAYTGRRLEEQQLEYEQAVGTGNARGIIPGALFKLTDYPGESEERTWLVTSASYALVSNDYSSGEGASGPDYQVNFRAIDNKRQFRPPLVTPKPTVQGPQTAMVVGEKGAEISTDKYGRVKVQFPWDREGTRDENSSIWVRVSQIWAGTKWGGLHVPRIGQEVIVDFLEGDPDQPIITGRVYNADQMPPYLDPNGDQKAATASATQSGIKSRSTPGGGPNNFNEIRFEDKKGQEELFMQAEKNKTVNVKNNRSASVGANDSVSVGGDRSVSVTGNLSVTVSGGGKSPVHSDHNVTGKYHLGASDCIDIDAPNYIKLTCKDSFILMEPGKITMYAGGKAMIVLDNHVAATSSDDSVVVLDENAFMASKKGGRVLLDANVMAQSKPLSTLVLDGDASLITKGDVKLGGANVQASGSQKVTANGGGSQLELSVAGANLSGQKVGISGSSMTEITGALVKIN